MPATLIVTGSLTFSAYAEAQQLMLRSSRGGQGSLALGMTNTERMILWGLLAGFAVLASGAFVAALTLFGAF